MGPMSRLFRRGEPPRDPELGNALRQLEATSRPGADDEALRMRIMAAARPRLAELRAPVRHWWEWISGSVRVAVPVGVAACVAAALLVPGRADYIATTAPTAVAGADSTLVLAAFSAPSAGDLTAHLVVPAGDDWLLSQALDR
jgi:hypothetical protein